MRALGRAMKHFAAAVVAWGLLTTLTFAQGVASGFSGRWELDAGQQTGIDVVLVLTIDEPPLQSRSAGSVRDSSNDLVRVVRELETGALTEVYRLGVPAVTISGFGPGRPRGPKTHVRATRAPAKLTIASGSYTGPMRESGEWTEQVETWSFEPDGRLRVTIASRGSNRPDTTVSRLYRRATRLRDSWTPGPRRAPTSAGRRRCLGVRRGGRRRRPGATRLRRFRACRSPYASARAR